MVGVIRNVNSFTITTCDTQGGLLIVFLNVNMFKCW